MIILANKGITESDRVLIRKLETKGQLRSILNQLSSGNMDRTQMLKTVESLRDQLRISRLPVSICSNE
jgi:hypothetical protein